MSAVGTIHGENIGLLTCITCRVGFRDGDLQRDHYKSDWHRYNLKRKVVDLAPVTVENFQERLSLQEAQQATEAKDTSQYCTVCKKSYGNEKAYRNHLTSKKHLQLSSGTPQTEAESVPVATKEANALASSLDDKCLVEEKGVKVRGKKFPPPPALLAHPKGKPENKMEIDDEDDDDDWEEVEGTPVPVNHCLFCGLESEDMESNLHHMSHEHSFFIPDVEYCSDIVGFMEYLGEKVGEGMMCLWCNEKGKQFYNVKSVQVKFLRPWCRSAVYCSSAFILKTVLLNYILIFNH
jgi:pre-60S factor REI1